MSIKLQILLNLVKMCHGNLLEIIPADLLDTLWNLLLFTALMQAQLCDIVMLHCEIQSGSEK